MRSAIGVPVVLPSKTPERISTRSSSFLDVEALWAPGLRRSNSDWMSASLRSRFGGQPSMTAPRAFPCDSPNVVTLKSEPKVLPDMGSSPLDFLFFVDQFLFQLPGDFCRNAGEILRRRVDDHIGDIPIDRQ